MTHVFRRNNRRRYLLPASTCARWSPATGLCEGCLRTIDEIVAWGRADDDSKRAVWAEIRRREAQIQCD
jgi:predicted Fe-S protein YdhL (DUF1289 family)